jgi:hypothetical protein
LSEDDEDEHAPTAAETTTEDSRYARRLEDGRIFWPFLPSELENHNSRNGKARLTRSRQVLSERAPSSY